MSRLLALAAGSALIAALAAPVSAEPQYRVRSEVVSHADLDLNHPADADVMIGRIHGASRRVCDDGPGMRTMAERSDETTCRQVAEADGVAATNSSTVIARHRGYDPSIVVAENDYVAPPHFEPNPYPVKK